MDPAGGPAFARTLAALAALGLDPRELAGIVLTRADPLQVAAAARLAASGGAWVAAHRDTALVAADPAAAAAALKDRWRRAAAAAGVPDDVTAAWARGTDSDTAWGADWGTDWGNGPSPPAGTAIRPLGDGEWLRHGRWSWQVLHLPGPAATQLGLWEPATAQLISGAILGREARPALGLDARRLPVPVLGAAAGSLRRVGRLAARIAWPAEGPPVRAHRIQVARRLATLRRDLGALRSALASAGQSPWDLALAIGLEADPARLPETLGQVAAYLEWLASRGEARRQPEGGRVHFARPEGERPPAG